MTETRDDGLTASPLGDVAAATDPMETRTGSRFRGLDALIPPRDELAEYATPSPREAMIAAVVAAEDERLLREPETVAHALADVHRRYCPPGSAVWHPDAAHDPVCRILSAALVKPLATPTGPKLGGQRQGGAPAATEAAELVAPKAGTQRAKVLAAFVVRLPDGRPSKDWDRTDVELCWKTGLPANSVRPRRVELVDAGWVEATGRTRVHNGRKHTLWTLTPAAREALA